MKALIKYEPGVGNVELREVAEPACGDNQVKIEVSFCGVCGTDLHVYEDTFRNFPPVILGHEFSGRVVQVGRLVRNIQPDDHATVLPATAVTCGSCSFCRMGYFMLCPDRRGMGHGVNGAFAKYAVVRGDQVYKIPAGLSLAEAALCEPFASAVQAVLQVTNVRLGDVALVSGPGPIGLLCLKILLAEGIKTIVTGTGEDAMRLEKAKMLGVDTVVNLTEQELATVVAEETKGAGVDVAFECAGAEASAANCLRALKPLGQYTQVGIFGRKIFLDFDQVFYKQLRVVGSVGYTTSTWDRLLKILEQKVVSLDDLITHRMPLERWQDAFKLCERKQAIKVLLSPS